MPDKPRPNDGVNLSAKRRGRLVPAARCAPAPGYVERRLSGLCKNIASMTGSGHYVNLYIATPMRSSLLCAVSIRCPVARAGNAAHSFGDSSKRTYQLATCENARQEFARNPVCALSREDVYEARGTNHLDQRSIRRAARHTRVLRAQKLCKDLTGYSQLFPRG